MAKSGDCSDAPWAPHPTENTDGDGGRMGKSMMVAAWWEGWGKDGGSIGEDGGRMGQHVSAVVSVELCSRGEFKNAQIGEH